MPARLDRGDIVDGEYRPYGDAVQHDAMDSAMKALVELEIAAEQDSLVALGLTYCSEDIDNPALKEANKHFQSAVESYERLAKILPPATSKHVAACATAAASQPKRKATAEDDLFLHHEKEKLADVLPSADADDKTSDADDKTSKGPNSPQQCCFAFQPFEMQKQTTSVRASRVEEDGV